MLLKLVIANNLPNDILSFFFVNKRYACIVFYQILNDLFTNNCFSILGPDTEGSRVLLPPRRDQSQAHTLASLSQQGICFFG